MRMPLSALPGAGHFPAGRFGSYPPADVVLAVATAALVVLGSALVLRASALRERAAAPEVDIGTGGVVRVVPMIDPSAPLLKLGGGRAAKLPERWNIKRPHQAVAPSAAAAPAERREAAHREAPKTSSERQSPTPANPTSESASPGNNAPTDTTQAVAEGQASSTDQDGGVSGAPAGPGNPAGVPEGTETDPLKARALDVYRSRLAAWFSSRFRVSGSGLPQSTLTKLRAGASVQIGPDGRASAYSLTPSGNAAFDAAARAALEGAKGQALPPPPENYPDLAQSQISLTFVCKEGRCD